MTRYTSSGAVSETVNFPAGDFAGFGFDGRIATASIISVAGTCFSQTNKINYQLYNSDGSALGSTQFCSGSVGTVGIVSIWGVVAGMTGSFYVGYTHQSLNVRSGRVRELNGTMTVDDIRADLGLIGYSLVDVAATQNNGFVSLGYFLITRQLPNLQTYNSVPIPPSLPTYQKIHGHDKTAALKTNTSMFVLNESFGYAGMAKISQFFGTATEQSGVLVQSDNKIIVGGQIPSSSGYKNIGLVRYSSVQGKLTQKVDFDGDAESDLAVWRPSSGFWYIQNSSDNSVKIFQFGLNGDTLTPGDFDGDGQIDLAVYRPSNGFWYRINSSNNTFSAFFFGLPGDIPAPGDFDGDDKTDLAVFRPSTSQWWLWQTYNNLISSVNFGVSEDRPTVGDFDGNGLDDIAVFRPSTGVWYRRLDSGNLTANQFGLSGDIPVQGDYDGDGRTDIAVFRPSSGVWYLQRSTQGFYTQQFGTSEDIPAANAFH